MQVDQYTLYSIQYTSYTLQLRFCVVVELESYGAEDDIVAADLDMHQLILNSEHPKSVGGLDHLNICIRKCA